MYKISRSGYEFILDFIKTSCYANNSKEFRLRKKPKNNKNMFFDILKNMILKNGSVALSIIKMGFEQKIGLKTKSTTN